MKHKTNMAKKKSGATRYFYADYETLKIIDGFERGEISKVCCRAIKEYANHINKIKERLE